MRICLVVLLCGIGLGCSDDAAVDPDTGAPPDGGPPPMRDVGPPPPDGASGPCNGAGCGTGCPCEPARGCAAAGHECQLNIGGTIGAANDPITGFEGSIPAPLFGSGYCTTAPLNLNMDPPSCTVGDDMSCPGCATCVSLGTVGGIPRTFCARDCTPSLTDDSCPDSARGNNTCVLGENYCLDGCMADDECRVFRIDTDSDGDIEAPAMGAPAVDTLEYRMTVNHRCDAATDRCVHDGIATASAGDTCSWDGECEPNGDCIYNTAWHDVADPTPGRGYCTKFGCDVAGNTCANGQKCNGRGFGGTFLCLAPCEVAANVGAPADPDYLFALSRDCRPGHRCLWDGSSAMGSADGGSCIPGNYNDVRAANIGETCANDGECYSPLGAGRCLGVLRNDADICTISDCAAPGVPGDICGADPDGGGPMRPAATCMQLGTDSFCRTTCGTAMDCGAETEACIPVADATTAGLAIAHPICTSFCFGANQTAADAQCRPGFTCGGTFAPGTALGTCVN